MLNIMLLHSYFIWLIVHKLEDFKRVVEERLPWKSARNSLVRVPSPLRAATLDFRRFSSGLRRRKWFALEEGDFARARVRARGYGGNTREREEGARGWKEGAKSVFVASVLSREGHRSLLYARRTDRSPHAHSNTIVCEFSKPKPFNPMHIQRRLNIQYHFHVYGSDDWRDREREPSR